MFRNTRFRIATRQLWSSDVVEGHVHKRKLLSARGVWQSEPTATPRSHSGRLTNTRRFVAADRRCTSMTGFARANFRGDSISLTSPALLEEVA